MLILLFIFSIFCAIQDLPLWGVFAMAFQTLGVVYGDMGTSPLYVFTDVFAKVPIKSGDDVLGALSLVMYTIALIPFAKYVFIVLKANDNGEGMELINMDDLINSHSHWFSKSKFS